MGKLWQDLRLATRALSRHPGFTLVAVLTLALGIGANAAIFSVVRGVLLRPLPYPEEGRLASFLYHSQGRRTASISQPELLDFQSKLASVEAAAGMTFRRLHLGESAEPRLVLVAEATPTLLPLLGVAPRQGRFYGAEESLPDGPPVVVISDGLRLQLFGEGGEAVGKTVMLGGTPHTVVGVMPAGFGFPDGSIEAYRPFRMDPASPDQRNNHYLRVVGRLKAGATLEAARAELSAYGRWAVAEYPEYYSGFNASFEVERLRDTFIGSSRAPLLLALGAVSLVLLIACANVASLLLARSEERRREVAVRLALGAARRHLARQHLVESAVLALLGGAVALPLAWAAVKGLVALAGGALPRPQAVSLDTPVLIYTLGLALATSLLFGLAPLLRALRSDLRGDLQCGVRSVSAGRGSGSLRRALVAGQVALAVVLIAGASLLTRTILALAATDLGFETEGNVAVRIALPPHLYQTPAEIAGFVRELEDRAGSLPGVTAVGSTDSVPLWQGFTNNLSLQVENRIVETVGEAPTAMIQKLSPGAFAVLGLRLKQGRLYSRDDVAASRPVAVVNEAFVSSVLRGADPFTTKVRMYSSRQQWMEIVGVVENFRQDQVVGEDWPQLMAPLELADRVAYRVPTDFSLLVRTEGSPQSLAAPLRSVVRETGPAVAVRDIRTLADVKHGAVGDRSFLARLVSIAAALALALAAVGLYGVIGLWVSQRQRELGLRMALGAERQALWRLVLIQAGVPVLAGLAVGLTAVVPLAFVLRSMLHHVSPVDPASLAVVVGVLAATACLAAVVPARRATRIDAASALRAD